jgi:glucokinase
VWLLRHKLEPQLSAEEGASIRAVRRVYAQRAGLPLRDAPEPKDIAAIALGQVEGNRAAAVAAFEQLGEVVGDAMASVLVLVDGLAVVGGGLSGAASLFLPKLVGELNGTYIGPDGKPFRRLTQCVFNLEEPGELKQFLASETRVLSVPGSARTVRHDSFKRIGVGLSRLGTSHAIAIGAYAYALRQLDAQSNGIRIE